ncbi:MAG: hypothetical protein A2580_00950 [Hydrogenophilales bacterium RIFOXYD1_FULL_62_11]|nr:MAG: hypothetical protein A2580_00950 [Hydrogenophilales bacterium RIFOXYD1_FULL_62_11]
MDRLSRSRKRAFACIEARWRRSMRRFFMVELPLSFIPTFVVLLVHAGQWSAWASLPSPAKALWALGCFTVFMAVWIFRLPSERPGPYSDEVDDLLISLRRKGCGESKTWPINTLDPAQ